MLLRCRYNIIRSAYEIGHFRFKRLFDPPLSLLGGPIRVDYSSRTGVKIFFSRSGGGCSEGLGAFRFFFKPHIGRFRCVQNFFKRAHTLVQSPIVVVVVVFTLKAVPVSTQYFLTSVLVQLTRTPSVVTG